MTLEVQFEWSCRLKRGQDMNTSLCCSAQGHGWPRSSGQSCGLISKIL